MSQHRKQYMDLNTRSYPRTMQQAFGPYTSHQLAPKQEPDRPMDWQDKLVIAACVVAMIALMVTV